MQIRHPFLRRLSWHPLAVAVPLAYAWYTSYLREFPTWRTVAAMFMTLWFGLSAFDLLTGHRWLDWLYSEEEGMPSSGDPAVQPEERADPDLALVDAFLRLWYAFAQGHTELAHALKGSELEEAALARLLTSGNPRAPGRLVFYAVVQVGGFVPADSELGRAAVAVLGPDFPIFTAESGQRSLFAGDLFFWWRDHGHQYEPFVLLDDWMASDFARQVAIPMYASACNRGEAAA